MLLRSYTLASALSLLLCAGAVAFWIRGYSVEDRVRWIRADQAGWRALTAINARGRLAITALREPTGATPVGGSTGVSYQRESLGTFVPEANIDPVAAWEFGGTIYQPTNSVAHFPSVRYQLLVIPWWQFTTTAAFAPLVWLSGSTRRWRKSQRVRTSQCKRCGYDLRASPNRCPECGSPAPKNAEATA